MENIDLTPQVAEQETVTETEAPQKDSPVVEEAKVEETKEKEEPKETKKEDKKENKEAEKKDEQPKVTKEEPEDDKKGEQATFSEEERKELEELRAFKQKKDYEAKLEATLKEQGMDTYYNFYANLPELTDEALEKSLEALKEQKPMVNTPPRQGEAPRKPLSFEEQFLDSLKVFNL